MAQDEAEKSKLLHGNRKVSQNLDCIFLESDIADFFTNHSTLGEKYIISDVARFGKDLATAFTFD